MCYASLAHKKVNGAHLRAIFVLSEKCAVAAVFAIEIEDTFHQRSLLST